MHIDGELSSPSSCKLINIGQVLSIGGGYGIIGVGILGGGVLGYSVDSAEI